MTPLPCPFCGSTNIYVADGSSFRWRCACCAECGAQCGEVRIQTLGEGTQEEWEAAAAKDAIAEWNRRPSEDRLRAENEADVSRSARLAAAGFTRRDTRLQCDECGKFFSPQFLPIHKCDAEDAE